MFAVVSVAASLICGIGWYFSKLAAKGLARFIAKSGYTPPTPEELRTCIKEVIIQKRSK